MKIQKKAKACNKNSRTNSSVQSNNAPFKRSDGYWYVWINDGRGGYDQILGPSDQNRLNDERNSYISDYGWDNYGNR